MQKFILLVLIFLEIQETENMNVKLFLRSKIGIFCAGKKL